MPEQDPRAAFAAMTIGAALVSPYATVALSAVVIVYFIVGPGAPSGATRVGGA